MNFFFLSKTILFHGIREEEISGMLSCLGAYEKQYRKDDIILSAGSAVTELGLVESGSVNVVVNFYWGNSNIFGHIGQGDIFAENYAAIPGRELLCDVVAAEDSEVLFLGMNKLISTCQHVCPFHRRLIQNLLRLSAMKSLNLSTRMMHIAPKAIRERLLSYLSEQAMEKGSAHFTIPFSRQQLADYLGVDRSALSNELSKMQKDGLIAYRKNEFTLNEGAARP